jgi:hypothetical protein
LISCACVLPSRLILFDLTFSLVPGPLFLLASVEKLGILPETTRVRDQ